MIDHTLVVPCAAAGGDRVRAPVHREGDEAGLRVPGGMPPPPVILHLLAARHRL